MGVRKQCVLLALFLLTVCSITAWGGSSPVNYTITDLGTLGGQTTAAFAINNGGQVTGSSYLLNDNEHAFLYSDGTMLDLGSLRGQYCSGSGLNNHGSVTGSSQLPGNTITHAWLYDGVSMHDIGTLGGSYSSGGAINDSGTVVGSSYLAGDQLLHAFLYDGMAMQDLGTLGGSLSGANAINNGGMIAGSSFTTGDASLHAFLFNGTTMQDLGTLPGGTRSVAFGMNDLGEVTGRSTLTGNPAGHAFLYDGTTMTDLGALNGASTGSDVNNHGVVVGSSDCNGPYTCAFVYTDDTMYDLNTLIPASSGWKWLIAAYGINDGGQIAGWGKRNDGSYGAFLLTPVGDKTPPVITVFASLAQLWPPDGKMVPVTIYGSITDDMSGVNAATATFSVADEYGQVQPSGHVAVASNGSYFFTISLQASRDGQDLDGRQYSVIVSAQDNAGNAGTASATVIVPHDQGH